MSRWCVFLKVFVLCVWLPDMFFYDLLCTTLVCTKAYILHVCVVNEKDLLSALSTRDRRTSLLAVLRVQMLMLSSTFFVWLIINYRMSLYSLVFNIYLHLRIYNCFLLLLLENSFGDEIRRNANKKDDRNLLSRFIYTTVCMGLIYYLSNEHILHQYIFGLKLFMVTFTHTLTIGFSVRLNYKRKTPINQIHNVE